MFDERGRPTGRAYREFRQHFPRPGWVEHDAGEIWDTTRAVAKEPLQRAIAWQDRRTARRCDELRDAGHEELVRERTGLVLDPCLSGTKIEWLIREGDVPADAAFGTIDSSLVFELTGEHATDHTSASRTLLFDIRRRRWDAELCDLLGVSEAALPEPRPSAHAYGMTSESGGSVPVAGIAGDRQAALYGQACREPGLRQEHVRHRELRAPERARGAARAGRGLMTPIAWGVGDRVDYALEAAIFVTGAAVQWLRDGLGIIRSGDETEELARSLDSNDGVYLVPASTGLGSPHWDAYARGPLAGLTRGSGRAHLARGARLPGWTRVAMEAESGVQLEELKADGGAVVNGWLMKFQADVLGVPVVAPEGSETNGARRRVPRRRGDGTWSEAGVGAMWRQAARYEPSMSECTREELLAGWARALERARSNEAVRIG